MQQKAVGLGFLIFSQVYIVNYLKKFSSCKLREMDSLMYLDLGEEDVSRWC